MPFFPLKEDEISEIEEKHFTRGEGVGEQKDENFLGLMVLSGKLGWELFVP